MSSKVYRRIRSPLLAKALLVRQFGAALELDPWHPIPIPGPEEVRIRCVAVGLNPVDWQSKDYNFGIASLPWVSGRDVAGIIDSVGSAVSGFRPGDPVFTLTDYSSPRCGAFQEFCIARASSVAQIPSHISFEQAAAVPVAAITAAIGLQRYMRLRKHIPVIKESAEWMLVWGGATNTGYFAVQLASLYGYRVVAVAGRRNFEYVHNAGADVVLDRNQDPETIVAELKNLTSSKLRYAFDAVGAETVRLCLRAMEGIAQTEEKVLIALAGLPMEINEGNFVNRKAVLPDGSLVSIPEVKVKLFHKEEAYGEQLLKDLTDYFEIGALKIPNVLILDGGLDAINSGLALLKSGKISGRKLVIVVEQTYDPQKRADYNGWL